MIINKTNIKALLGITSSEYDTKIDILLPVFINDAVKYCNNHFIMQKQSNRITIVDNEITVVTDIDMPLAAGDFISFGLSVYNKEVYQIESLTTNTITISSSYPCINEDFSGYLGFTRFPSEFLNIIADYFQILFDDNKNVESERLGDHQIKYTNVNSDDFVKFSARKLQLYRNPYSDNDIWVEKYYGY